MSRALSRRTIIRDKEPVGGESVNGYARRHHVDPGIQYVPFHMYSTKLATTGIKKGHIRMKGT